MMKTPPLNVWVFPKHFLFLLQHALSNERRGLPGEGDDSRNHGETQNYRVAEHLQDIYSLHNLFVFYQYELTSLNTLRQSISL